METATLFLLKKFPKCYINIIKSTQGGCSMGKKFSKVFVFGVVCLFLLCGCTSGTVHENGYNSGYENGYNKGYEEGVKYVLSSLRENANGYDLFMNVEDIEEGIDLYLESHNLNGDYYDARDYITDSPDLRHYIFSDMLDELIQSCIEE
jgi:hypothetical protein